MSLWSQLRLLFRSLVQHAMGEVEEPGQALDLAYARQIELLGEVRRAVADVVTARKRIELQARQLTATVGRLEVQARTSLEQGREEVAQDALTRRAMLRGELDLLGEQAAVLGAEESRLVAAAKRLDLQIQQFRVRREALRATSAAAEARARVDEAVAELSQEGVDLRVALQQAEARVADTRARAAALEGLIASGALAPGRKPGDAAGLLPPVTDTEVQRELLRLEEERLWGPGGLGGDPGPGSREP